MASKNLKRSIKKLRKLAVDSLKTKFIDDMPTRFRKAAKPLADETKEQIQRGISPVEGAGKFPKYSESYRNSIKKHYGEAEKKLGQVSPVNMTLSGDMLKALKVVINGGKIFLEFTGKVTGLRAYYHNNSGAGKIRKIRRLLPDAKGERFNTVLQNLFYEIVRDIVKKIRPHD